MRGGPVRARPFLCPNVLPRAPRPVRLLLRVRSSRLPVLLAAALIAVAACIAYSNSFAGAFVLDDEPAIVENPNLRRLWPLTTAMHGAAGDHARWPSSVSLTFALNYAFAPADARDVLRPTPAASPIEREQFRRNLWGYHALNLIIHIGAALTLFGIVRRTLLTRPSGRFRQSACDVARTLQCRPLGRASAHDLGGDLRDPARRVPDGACASC